MRFSRIAAFAIWAVVAAPVTAQDFEAGIAAAQAGDYATTLEIFRSLAEQGDANAQQALGQMYRNGTGVLQNYAEGLRWYRLAAEQGGSRPQFFVGLMYFQGEGVPQNYVMAHMWFNLAMANGGTEISETFDLLGSLMTNEQIAEAQARARVCMSSGYQDCD